MGDEQCFLRCYRCREQNQTTERKNNHDSSLPEREQRDRAKGYLNGLLSRMENKSVEAMVIEQEGPDPSAIRSMQHFISEGTWDDTEILRRHWQEVSKDLAEEDGVYTLDGSDFPKQGDGSVGVKRQHCGELGKIANCQAGVFLGYVSRKGYTLLDRRLYLPEEWVKEDSHAERREESGVPEDTPLPQLVRLSGMRWPIETCFEDGKQRLGI